MARRRHRGQAQRRQPPRPPPDPRRIGRLLGAMLLIGATALAAYAGGLWVSDPEHLPVRALRVTAPLEQVSAKELRDAVVPHTRLGILYLNVDEVRAALESLPWVRRAEVRRSWPDVLTLDIEEFRAFARWSEGGLVSDDGVRFNPHRHWGGAADLPVLHGPAGNELTMVEQFRSFSAHLAPSGLRIAELTMDERYAWSLKLSDGVAVALGRNAHDVRLERLVTVYRGILKANTARVERLDLRYTNGFSVRWREQSAQAGA